MYKVTKQFGLARRSGTFLLDAGVPPWRDGQTKVQLWLNVPERSEQKLAGVLKTQPSSLMLVLFTFNSFIFNYLYQLAFAYCCMLAVFFSISF